MEKKEERGQRERTRRKSIKGYEIRLVYFLTRYCVVMWNYILQPAGAATWQPLLVNFASCHHQKMNLTA